LGVLPKKKKEDYRVAFGKKLQLRGIYLGGSNSRKGIFPEV